MLDTSPRFSTQQTNKQINLHFLSSIRFSKGIDQLVTTGKKKRPELIMGNTSSRPFDPRAPPDIYHDLVSQPNNTFIFRLTLPSLHPSSLKSQLFQRQNTELIQGYGDIISNPLIAPAAAGPPKLKGRRTLSFALTRRSTAHSSRKVLVYPKNYHW